MTAEKSSRFVILYASQTGNSEWIAKNIHQEALERGFVNECHGMEEHDKVDLSKENILILVSSNTGDGDPPENATNFFRFMRKIKSNTFLSHLQFAILGLGDTNYTNFNNTAKRLEKKLLELGATPFYEKGLADDAMGLEATVDPWIEKLWPALAKVCVQKGKNNNNAHDENIVESVKNLSVNDKSDNNDLSLPLKLPNELSVDEKMNFVIGTKITFELSELAKAETLTALPRIPTVICKIVKSNKKESINPASLPPFINTSTPIVNARLDTVRCLTHPDALKRTIHLELDIKDYKEKLEFVPGDSIGIIAPNNKKLVLEILKTLEIGENEANQEISIESLEGTVLPSHLRNAQTTSIMELFRYGVDLTSLPRKALLRLMAEYTTDEEERKTLLFLCSKQGADQFNRLRHQIPTLLDLLVTFPSCKPPVERLFDVLPSHQPRYYSIANSPLVNRDSFHIAFNIVDYKTPDPYGVRKFGVCTPWLDNLSGHVNEWNKRFPLTTKVDIPIFMKQNTYGFAVPSDISRPMIMIGPGTGVAPFIGFIQHREQQIIAERRSDNIEKSLGEMWLFYGCRDIEKDHLYREELEGFLKRGILKELLVATSRAPDAGLNGNPKYVQDLLRKRGQELYELLDRKDAMIFVYAQGMAKDVNDALADILVEYGNMQRSDSLKLLAKWMNDKRYLRDLWS
ncbi:7584_t:CDS:2 [Funneliformis caledonium]|uniref:Methionine synthase reductase n=1 Tax=Funneliformis caledonium TaxID=1117310 RepID=A0A9N9CIX8_9GLOM|nr:7584_t:CDS:2 [Funneliformis caledonium]